MAARAGSNAGANIVTANNSATTIPTGTRGTTMTATSTARTAPFYRRAIILDPGDSIRSSL